jgi:hypothetical protein
MDRKLSIASSKVSMVPPLQATFSHVAVGLDRSGSWIRSLEG